MSTYTPDAWVVLEIQGATEVIRKVLGGWYGGFANGDSWKLNSGIEETVETPDYYDFIGYSGSTYRCYKSAERMTGLTSAIYASFKETLGDRIKIVRYGKDEFKTEETK